MNLDFTPEEQAEIADLIHDLGSDAGPILRMIAATTHVEIVSTMTETEALLRGLELLPRRQAEYRGTTLPEFDIDAALDVVTTDRATYGAAMSRFSYAISNLQITGENQSAARGRIIDADFASETANLSRAQILQQAGSAMVAQANQLPNQVLALLR